MDDVVAGIVVVDSGLTENPVIACNTPAGQETGFYHHDACPPEQREPIRDSELYGSVSYGFVVENTGDQAVGDVLVTYRFLDADGEVVVEHATAFSDSDRTGDTESISLILPGERVGIGGMTYPGQPGAAEMEIEVGEPLVWMPEAANKALFHFMPHLMPGGGGGLSVSEVDVRDGEDNEPVTTFTVESSYEVAVDPGIVYVIFYDTDGQIIGGADGWDVDDIPAGGTISAEIALNDPLEVPGIDPSRTEIYFPAIRVVS